MAILADVLDVTPPRTVGFGGRTAFACTSLSGESSSSAILHWHKDGQPLESGANVDVIHGNVTSTLILKQIHFDDAGSYSCDFRDNSGEVIASANTSLTVIGMIWMDEDLFN